MTKDELAGYIDLTLLRPNALRQDVEETALKAFKYPFASLFIPPCHVRLAAKLLKGSPVKVGTAVGFPLGYQTTATKLFEATDAVEDGAEEIDMVMNISCFKSGDFNMVQDEISAIVSALPKVVVKVIIGACYLTDEEKVRACNIVINSGAHFVKMSTGFGPGGATIEDVRLLTNTAEGRIKVKASGGIRNLEETLKMIDAGAVRIGTSSGIQIVEEV